MTKPDKNGFYGQFGGMFVPDTLMPALKEFEVCYTEHLKKPEFQKELQYYLTDYVGRPTPLFYAENLSKQTGYKIYLKREDLNHTGAHKINNTVGQILLAKKMGKKRIIAETGAGQHGVATATVCALMNVECHIFMGEGRYSPPRIKCLSNEVNGRKCCSGFIRFKNIKRGNYSSNS